MSGVEIPPNSAGETPDISHVQNSAQKLVHIVGTRPNVIKAARLIPALAAQGFQQSVVHTGQHYDSGLSATEIPAACLSEPVHVLSANGYSGSDALQVEAMRTAIQASLSRLKPDAVLVYGDVNSALAGTFAAKEVNIPIVHIEAGLRSSDRSSIEERNRQRIDHLSDILFCPEWYAADHLLAEHIPAEKVFITGNLHLEELQEAVYEIGAGQILLKSGSRPRLLVTLHRRENTKPERLIAILGKLNVLGNYFSIVFPAHPKIWTVIDRDNAATQFPKIDFSDPLSRKEMLQVLHEAELVVTDSGGLQMEAYFLAKPCMVLNKATPWEHTIHEGGNVLLPEVEELNREHAQACIKGVRQSGRKREQLRAPFPSERIAMQMSRVLAQNEDSVSV